MYTNALYTQTYTQENNMFIHNQIIDAIQDSKKTFVTTCIKDETFQSELVKLIDAQTKAAKVSVEASIAIVTAFTKNASNAFYKKA